MRPPETTVFYGDAWDLASELRPESIDCIVTSPPYFGLRDYGHPGQFGLEATPAEYVEKLVDLFRRIRLALKGGGTVWLNVGDSYATGAGKVGDCPGGGDQGARWLGQARTHKMGPTTQPNRMPLPGLKPKDLCMIPARVALALQADGWWLRQDIIWSKPNPMPESVRDRPSLSHEHVLLLTRSRRYYFDMDAVKEPLRSGPSDLKKMARSEERLGGLVAASTDPKAKASSLTNIGRKRSVGDKQAATEALAKHGHRYEGFNKRWDAAEETGDVPGGRFLRSVWELGTQSYRGAHFATMPPRLAERCILAGCPEGGTVLDPFMGSGTTAQVARNLGRDCIGFELNENYRPLIEKRLAQQVLV